MSKESDVRHAEEALQIIEEGTIAVRPDGSLFIENFVCKGSRDQLEDLACARIILAAKLIVKDGKDRA